MKNKPKKNVNPNELNLDEVHDFDLDDAHDFDLVHDEADETDSEDSFDEEASEMLFVLETIYEFITDMLSQKIHPHLIESSLLANWLQVVVMNCEESEEFFLGQLEKLEELITLTIKNITDIANALPEEIDEPLSSEARSHFSGMQALIKDLSSLEMAPDDFVSQEKILELAHDDLFEIFERANAHPLDVEAGLLFYWIHFLSMDHEFSSAKIEKLIYYWGDVFEPMAIFIRKEMGLDDAF
jgi:hypothetical protein